MDKLETEHIAFYLGNFIDFGWWRDLLTYEKNKINIMERNKKYNLADVADFLGQFRGRLFKE